MSKNITRAASMGAAMLAALPMAKAETTVSYAGMTSDQSITWVMSNNAQKICAVDGTQGSETNALTVNGAVEVVTTQFKAQKDGYAYQAVTHQGTSVTVLIKGDEVIGTDPKGKQGKLSDDQAQPFIQGLANMQSGCVTFLKQTAAELVPNMPNKTLPTGTVISINNGGPIKQVIVSKKMAL